MFVPDTPDVVIKSWYPITKELGKCITYICNADWKISQLYFGDSP